MKKPKHNLVLAVVAGGLALGGAWLPTAFSAGEPFTLKMAGGALQCAKFAFKMRGDHTTLFTFTGHVRARAQDPAKSWEVNLENADKGTAQADAKWDFDTVKTNGNVRFSVRQAFKTHSDRATGRCKEATFHFLPKGKTLTGDERFLVADMEGDVRLTLTRVSTGKPAAGTEEPMELEGAHAQVWQTAEGLEGNISGDAD